MSGREEAELRAAARQFRVFAQLVDQTLAVATDPGLTQFAYLSPAFESIWARRAPELGALPELISASLHEADRPVYEERCAAGPPWHAELRIVRPCGETRYLEASSRQIPNFGDLQPAYALLLRDITAEKVVEGQLHQALRVDTVGRLAATVAHDFNNLLAVIGTYGELVRMSLDNETQQAEDVDQILLAVRKSTGVIRQLLTFTRSETWEPELIQMNALAEELGPMFGRLLGATIDLDLGLGRNIGSVHVDPTHLEQILMNLVVNARHAMPEGGRLSIRTQNVDRIDDQAAADGPWVQITVTDTGCGMDQETLGRALEPFFSTKDEASGTGLGLSTVRELMEKNDGELRIESAPGRGTSVRLYFPWLEELSATDDVVPDKPDLRGTETILLVEDDDSLRPAMRRVLENAGYTVLEASSPGDAIFLAEEQSHIDLLLSDVVLPRLNGFRLADRIETRHPTVKVQLMSAYPIRASWSAPQTGPRKVIEKPHSPARLLEEIRKVFDGSLRSTTIAA